MRGGKDMNALYDLRDMLCAQLEDYGKKGELSASVLDKVDILAHATKNIDKIIACNEGEDGEYSGSYGGYGRRSSRRSYNMSSSRRMSRRSGKYHGDSHDEEDDDLVDQVYAMIDKTTDDKTRQDLQRFADRMEQVR